MSARSSVLVRGSLLVFIDNSDLDPRSAALRIAGEFDLGLNPLAP